MDNKNWIDNPDYGVLMPVDEWLADVHVGALINYDGIGYYSDGKRMNDAIEVYPSMVEDGTFEYAYDYIMWFNR